MNFSCSSRRSERGLSVRGIVLPAFRQCYCRADGRGQLSRRGNPGVGEKLNGIRQLDGRQTFPVAKERVSECISVDQFFASCLFLFTTLPASAAGSFPNRLLHCKTIA